MPRLLRRLSIAFAVLAFGLAVALWVGIRAVATNVINDQAEPVRKKLLADWEAHADALERDLLAAAPWAVTGERTPVELGCQLRWSGQSPAVQQHLARCHELGPAVRGAVVEQLEKLGDEVLRRESEAPIVERDFGWMAATRGHDDWSQAAGTPLEFIDPDPRNASVMDVPTIDARQLGALVTLHLLAGHRSGKPEDAAADVTALARALLGRPVISDQLLGLSLLERLRAQLAAIDRLDLAPNEESLKSLRGSRLAAALLWHPWVPKQLRARFLPKIAPASRCAAAGEAMLLLELGEPLRENYPDFVTDFTAWRQGACASDFVNRGLDARASPVPGTWQRAFRTAVVLDGADPSAPGPALVIRAAESSALTRRAALETLFSVIDRKSVV